MLPVMQSHMAAAEAQFRESYLLNENNAVVEYKNDVQFICFIIKCSMVKYRTHLKNKSNQYDCGATFVHSYSEWDPVDFVNLILYID